MKIYLNPTERLKEKVEAKYTVAQLKAMCKEKGLTGYSKLKEAELIKLLSL